MVRPMTLVIILLAPMALMYGVGAFTMWDMTWPMQVAEFRAQERFLIVATYIVFTALFWMGYEQ